MPKSFTEDGAAGAGESGGGYNPNPVGGGFQGGSPIDDSGMTMGGGRQVGVGPKVGGGLGSGSYMPGSLTPNYGADGKTVTSYTNSGPGPVGGGFFDQKAMDAAKSGQWGTWNDSGNLPPGAGTGFMFANGGEVEGANEQFGFDPMAAQGDLVEKLAAARATVTHALDFGRKQNGLEQLAGLNRMPTVPGNQSESGAPRERPFPRLEPTQNPFGKRAEGAIPDDDDTGDAPVGFNPSQSETGVPRPPPGPGTLPPAPVPFGKRRQFSEAEDAPPEQTASAIPEEDTEETA